MEKIVVVLWESAISFIILFIISKLLGKRQVAQLQFSDYVVGISIGSIAAQMAFDTEFPFYTYIIAMAVFALLDLSVALISRKSKLLKRILNGKPLILIENGKLNYENLKKSKLDINELISQARFKGFFNLTEIAFCVFETSGSFSFLPKGKFKIPNVMDLQLKPQQSELTNYIVIDGKIDNEKLKDLKLSKNELFKKLDIKKNEELKDIAVAFVESNKYEVIRKINKKTL